MIGLVIPGNIWFTPFLNIYTKVLDEKGIDYTIISWNRDGNDKKIGYQFDVRAEASGGKDVLKPYLKYVNFIKKTIKKAKIDKLIIFGPQIGIFLSPYLWRNFKGKYIFDYRDLSIEQKFIFKLPFRILLKNAAAIFVSSPGFIKYLPKGFDYHLSHNFNTDWVRTALASHSVDKLPHPIEVLTIGGIRDYSSNVEVVKALSNTTNVHMSFVGKGPAAPLLEKYAKENSVSNITFSGFYEKQDEPNHIKSATFLNIYYPRKLSHDTALSNRFYNSLIFNRPMIVTKGTTQGDYCEEYNLGLSLENCDNLGKSIDDFILSFNEEEFKQRCDSLLLNFLDDYNNFENIINRFISI